MLLEILATVIVLHSSLDKASRDFVETIPRGADVQIIDWYLDDTARFKYMGPPPSAFPSVILNMPDGSLGTLRTPKNWDDTLEAIASPKGKAETCTAIGAYIGGQRKDEVIQLLVEPEIPALVKAVILDTLAKPEVANSEQKEADIKTERAKDPQAPLPIEGVEVAK